MKNELLAHLHSTPALGDSPGTGSRITSNITLFPMILRPDGDPSCFDTAKFKKECEELHILLDFVPTCTPQHNRAERAIEAIDYKARVSLVDAPHMDFNEHYYDASSCATYLHNRVVGSRGKTPYEIVKGQQPMLSHIVPFGCKGVAHIPKGSGRRKDTNERGEQVCHVGYRSPFSHEYKIYTLNGATRHSIHVD